MSTLSETAATALFAACAHKGKHKGRLLAKAPRSNTLAYAAWQGAMLVVNPYKVSLGGMIFMSAEQRAVAKEVELALEAVGGRKVLGLDRDRAALEALGVW